MESAVADLRKQRDAAQKRADDMRPAFVRNEKLRPLFTHDAPASQCSLGALLIEVLHRRLLRDLYNSIPSGPMHNTIENLVKTAVNSTVRAAAGDEREVWRAAMQVEIDSLRENQTYPVAAKEELRNVPIPQYCPHELVGGG